MRWRILQPLPTRFRACDRRLLSFLSVDAARLIYCKQNKGSHELPLFTGADDQNKKYRCAIGSTSAGSHHRSTPSALTW